VGQPAPDDRGQTPPVSLIAVSFPLQFQINDLKAWAYGCEDPARLLQGIATRAVVQQLAGSDFLAVMASGRLDAAEALRTEIQAEADRLKLGVKINFIGLQDIHPPVAVAGEFESVVSAAQRREASILNARAAASQTNALSDAEAFQLVALAEAYRTREQINVLARTALFTNQIPAYRAAPSLYLNRAYFQTVAEATRDARKFVLLTTNTQDVLQFDLQEKLGSDFSNIRLTPVN
jgi:membrane protease subunit HflK